jgi:hypothetical protein
MTRRIHLSNSQNLLSIDIIKEKSPYFSQCVC